MKIAWLGHTMHQGSSWTIGLSPIASVFDIYLVKSVWEFHLETLKWKHVSVRRISSDSLLKVGPDDVGAVDLSGYDVIFDAVLLPHNIEDSAYTDCVPLWERPDWKDLPAKKILVDLESWLDIDFYLNAKPHYDEVLSWDPRLSDICSPPGVTLEAWRPREKRQVSVIFTGNSLTSGYRNRLLRGLDGVKGATYFQPLMQTEYAMWVQLLCNSKIAICTFAPAISGEQYPYGIKGRCIKALAAGALPVSESWDVADKILAPGTERVTFDEPEELADLCNYYLDHEDERKAVVEAGRARVKRDWTWEKIYKRVIGIEDEEISGQNP